MSYSEPSEWDETEDKEPEKEDDPLGEIERENLLACLNRGIVYKAMQLESLI